MGRLAHGLLHMVYFFSMSQSTVSQALHFVCTTNVNVVVFIIIILCTNALISNDTSNIFKPILFRDYINVIA